MDTTLQSILDDRFNLIESKELLIRQLQDEIAQARLFTQAAEGVSSTLDNAKELFFNAMCSFYSLMQHEPEEVKQQAVEKIWDDFEQLDTQARQHVQDRKALASELEIEENQTDMYTPSIPTALEEPVLFEEEQSDNSPTVEVTAVPVEAEETESNARLLTAAQLKKDKVDWVTLKALARAKGVTSKKRPEMEAELLAGGVTERDLKVAQIYQ